MAQEKEKEIAAEEKTSDVPAGAENAETPADEQAPQPQADVETTDVPADEELFVGQVVEELSERQLFAGDEDFYKFLAKSARGLGDEFTFANAAQATLPMIPTRYGRVSTTQKILVAGIILIAGVLLYGFLKSPSRLVISIAPTPGVPETPDVRQIPAPRQLPAAEQPTAHELSVPGSGTIKQSHAQHPQTASARPGVDAISPNQPLSLKVAETFYNAENYDKAYAVYARLYHGLTKTPGQELIRDFLQLRMALCLQGRDDIDTAARVFRTIDRSDSPVVRTLANYHLSLIEVQKNSYLQARTRAYKTIALLGTLDFDPAWAQSIRRDCHLLAAEVITRNILSLSDAEKDLPEELWNTTPIDDPFAGLDEAKLHSVLQSGRNLLTKALLGPQIQRLQQQLGSSPQPKTENNASPPDDRWSVVCHGAPIDELLARFAANAGLDIHWVFSEKSAAEQIDSVIRRRPVSLHLSAATAQQFAAVAAGSAGLLAQLDENNVVNVYNPVEYESLSQYIDLLRAEAVSLWQRFMIAYYDDKRIAKAHFALGLLQAQKGLIAPAIAEHKIVASRFPESSLAPMALMQSSKLKTNLRDYTGARADLKQLVEQYPGTEIASQACLYLADATMNARLYHEAAKLYRKVYNLALSLESQRISALRAGICYYERKDYETAAKWLNRYIEIASESKSSHLYSAYLYLGKTSLQL